MGEFGDAYVERCPPRPETVAERVIGFGRMLEKTEGVTSVLEVGANVGINVLALRQLIPGVSVGAVEPNAKACEHLSTVGATVYTADAYDVPVEDESFDLALTCGVLIHVPPDRLGDAMIEVARASRRYILSIEYFAPEPVEILYRGHPGMLWKRDFGKAWLQEMPHLRCIDYGFLWTGEFLHGWDNPNWWLFEK